MQDNLKSLSLKIPQEIHSELKVFAAAKNIKLISFTQNIIGEAAKDNELLKRAAEKSKME